MSSTRRGGQREASDYYVTPIGAVRQFLDAACREDGNFAALISAPETRILDPCAGGDGLHPMSYPEALASRAAPGKMFTVDIREDSPADLRADYLSLPPMDPPYDLVISNPPFALAREFVEHALGDVREGGYVVFLLRLNFFGGKKRLDLWSKIRPLWAFVHHRRMSFTDDGCTDSIEYMHAVWRKGKQPPCTQLLVI